VIDIDLLDPDLHASGRALEALDRAREVSPVAWTRGRRGRGYWSVTGLRELVQVARDPATFSSWWGTRPEVIRPEGARRPLHNLDPPEHGILRRIAEAALDAFPSPMRHVQAFVAAGGGDVVRDLAEPMCNDLFGEWLDLDGGELATRVWTVHAAGAGLLDADRSDPARAPLALRAREATHEIGRFFERALAGATRGPLTVIRERSTGEEAIALAALLAEAGLPTLTDAVGSAVFDLATHPHVPRGPHLVDELLRRASPIVQFARRARKTTVMADARIEEGDQLVLWFLAANHDPRSFERPHELLSDRTPNPHVAFGFGAHRCLGNAFARRMLGELVTELPTVTIVEPPIRRRSSYLRGFTKLLVRFESAR
jgi:cytochrome P450